MIPDLNDELPGKIPTWEDLAELEAELGWFSSDTPNLDSIHFMRR
jgi:hypothetical protein